MRAIDLYSGIGGWSLGLRMAGIDVVASYERHPHANETNGRNNHHPTILADIRQLVLDCLPNDIDIVVGSPPCTQFSYSNRGGRGDIADGLTDIEKFLSVVNYLKPKYWLMENVPRVAEILERELSADGSLQGYRHLDPSIRLYIFDEFGLPQKRKRCVIGNIDFDLLDTFKAQAEPLTLGSIVNALAGDTVKDPIYGVVTSRRYLTDHCFESYLSEEEARINRSVKELHPVYNAMSFPDRLDRPSRTITSTYTRVSREGIIISDPRNAGLYRRLTLRERACLQGFPITFQFFAPSYGQKETMIGNAVPPPFAYYAAQAILRADSRTTKPLGKALRSTPLSKALAVSNVPEKTPRSHAATRLFRFVIPGFGFKSGVRFELSNRKAGQIPAWNVAFFFGKSTDVKEIRLDRDVFSYLSASLNVEKNAMLKLRIAEAERYICSVDIKRMQDVWTGHRPGLTRPFDFLDGLAKHGEQLAEALKSYADEQVTDVVQTLLKSQFKGSLAEIYGLSKFTRNPRLMIAGFLIGSIANRMMPAVNETNNTSGSEILSA